MSDRDWVLAVGWLLTLAGWIITFFVGRSHQKESHRLEVREHARRELAPDLVAYQRWASNLYAKIVSIQAVGILVNGPFGSADYFWKLTNELREALYGGDEALAMFNMLEDYDAVFPQAKTARQEFIAFHSSVTDFCGSVLSRFMSSLASILHEVPELLSSKGRRWPSELGQW